jgi:hypothetical protein
MRNPIEGTGAIEFNSAKNIWPTCSAREWAMFNDISDQQTIHFPEAPAAMAQEGILNATDHQVHMYVLCKGLTIIYWCSNSALSFVKFECRWKHSCDQLFYLWNLNLNTQSMFTQLIADYRANESTWLSRGPRFLATEGSLMGMIGRAAARRT